MSEETPKKIYKAIADVMGKIGSIGKKGDAKMNGKTLYKFRGIDDVYNALNPLLSEHGVFCVPKVIDQKREERKTKSGGTLIYTILTVEYTFYAEDGSSVVAQVVGEAMDSGDKSCNKAMSAAQKYAFFQIFSIPTEEQKDTETETHEVGAKTTNNFKFLKVMKEEKERLGEQVYYQILGDAGYEHSNMIPDGDPQVAVYKNLQAITGGNNV